MIVREVRFDDSSPPNLGRSKSRWLPTNPSPFPYQLRSQRVDWVGVGPGQEYYSQSHYTILSPDLSALQTRSRSTQYNASPPEYPIAYYEPLRPTSVPTPNYYRPVQKYDLSTESGLYYQTHTTVGLSSPIQPHLPNQQANTVYDLEETFYNVHTLIPQPSAITNPPPAHQASQRYDSLYDFDCRWWEQLTRWPVPLNRPFNPPVEFVSWQGTTNVEIAWQGMTNLAITWQGQSNLAITW